MKTAILSAIFAVAGSSVFAATETLYYDFSWEYTGGSYNQQCANFNPDCTQFGPRYDYEEGRSGQSFLNISVDYEDGNAFPTSILGSGGPTNVEFAGIRSGNVDERGVGEYVFGTLERTGLTTITFNEDRTGSILFEDSDGSNGGAFFREISRFAITDFTVSGAPEPLPEPEFAPVPLPASGIMLLAGLGGLGAWRRKKA